MLFPLNTSVTYHNSCHPYKIFDTWYRFCCLCVLAVLVNLPASTFPHITSSVYDVQRPWDYFMQSVSMMWQELGSALTSEPLSTHLMWVVSHFSHRLPLWLFLLLILPCSNSPMPVSSLSVCLSVYPWDASPVRLVPLSLSILFLFSISLCAARRLPVFLTVFFWSSLYFPLYLLPHLPLPPSCLPLLNAFLSSCTHISSFSPLIFCVT